MKGLNKSIPFFFIFVFIITSVYGQHNIKGTVTDAKTGETMPGVNVYLSNTTTGTSTNVDGTYQLSRIPPGIYELVFSFVGYQKRVTRVELKKASSNSTLNARLQPQTQQMEEVTVTASNSEWKDNFERFRKEFIGETSFAEDTQIINKIELHFEKDPKSGDLRAFSDEPLIVENNALGYKIYIEIEDFSWSGARDEGYFTIYPRFEEMTPESKKQREEWAKNREKTYEGSLRHFMKSLYDENLKSEKFTILNPSYLVTLNQGETKFELLGRPGVDQNLASILKGYRITQDLQVQWGIINQYSSGRAGNFSYDQKRSVLFPYTKDKKFFIDPNGNLLNSISIGVNGYWSRFRLADQLPFNYPENINS